MVQEDGNKDLHPIIEEFKQLGVQTVSVGIGDEAKLPELKKIASKNTTALHFGEYEAPRTIGKAIIRGKISFVFFFVASSEKTLNAFSKRFHMICLTFL